MSISKTDARSSSAFSDSASSSPPALTDETNGADFGREGQYPNQHRQVRLQDGRPQLQHSL